jgi:hypothetical protein
MTELTPMVETLYLFVDEAGDLGFGKGATRTFVVSYMITKNPN